MLTVTFVSEISTNWKCYVTMSVVLVFWDLLAFWEEAGTVNRLDMIFFQSWDLYSELVEMHLNVVSCDSSLTVLQLGCLESFHLLLLYSYLKPVL